MENLISNEERKVNAAMEWLQGSRDYFKEGQFGQIQYIERMVLTNLGIMTNYTQYKPSFDRYYNKELSRREVVKKILIQYEMNKPVISVD